MKRVLVVDDSESLRGYLAAKLQATFTVEVDQASDGFTALSKLATTRSRYDLLFIDLQMPGMNGIELLREIANRGCRSDVVIISVLDARVIQLAVEIARQFQLNVIGSVQKPLDDAGFELIRARLSRPDYLRPVAVAPLSEAELKDAIISKQLQPYFQVQVDSATQRVVGIEALARICRPGSSAAITPEYFLSTAMDARLLKTIDLLIFEQATRMFATLLRELPGFDCRLSVNVSPEYLSDRMVPKILARKVEIAGLRTEQICLEVTEQQVVNSLVQLETLERLRIAGFRLAIDDFGTGFTHINQLTRYPISEVKIDRGLIHNVAGDALAKVIVRSLVDVAGAANLDVVAEGVEREADLDYLMKFKNITLQGFLVAKPKPFSELWPWLSNWQKLQQGAAAALGEDGAATLGYVEPGRG